MIEKELKDLNYRDVSFLSFGEAQALIKKIGDIIQENELNKTKFDLVYNQVKGSNP